MEKSNKKIDIVDILVKIVLIAVIIILLLHNCSMLKKINNNKKTDGVPTGNVDIFEFKCEEKKCHDVLPDKKDIPEPDNNSKNAYKTPSNNTKPASDEKTPSADPKPDESTEPAGDEDDFIVADTVNWKNQNELRIFSNPLFEMEEKIAPESSNVYQFIVRNKTSLKINYKMTFIETNKKNINMMYRLKRGSDYIIGDNNKWVTAEELNSSNIELNSNSDHVYYLEWKWFSSNNDTNVGTDVTSKYKLNISIEAEGTNE